MSNKVLSIFCVINTKNDEADILSVFCADTFNNAKLWFQGYITGEKTPQWFVLYKIGEFTNEKELTIKPFKIFVCTGRAMQEISAEEKRRYIQNKLFREQQEIKERKENAEILHRLYESKVDFVEILKTAFNGKVIYEKE